MQSFAFDDLVISHLFFRVNTTKTADKPVNPPKITSLTVETYGVDYGMPETQKPFDYYSYMMQQYYNSSNVGGTSGTYSTGNQ